MIYLYISVGFILFGFFIIMSTLLLKGDHSESDFSKIASVEEERTEINELPQVNDITKETEIKVELKSFEDTIIVAEPRSVDAAQAVSPADIHNYNDEPALPNIESGNFVESDNNELDDMVSDSISSLDPIEGALQNDEVLEADSETAEVTLFEDDSDLVDYSSGAARIDSTLDSYKSIKRIGLGRIELTSDGINFYIEKKLYRFDFHSINDISADPSQKFIFFPMELMNMFKK